MSYSMAGSNMSTARGLYHQWTEKCRAPFNSGLRMPTVAKRAGWWIYIYNIYIYLALIYYTILITLVCKVSFFILDQRIEMQNQT